MKLGRISFSLLLLVLATFNFTISKSEDKIFSSPIINLENLEPSYENLENDLKEEIISNQKLKTVKPPRISSTATGLTGREGTLKESQRVQEGINALTVANIKATIGVKQAQFGYNVELLKARATQLALNADINAAKGAWNGVLSVLKRGTGLLGGLLGGKGGKLGQAAGIIGVSSAVEQLIQN